MQRDAYVASLIFFVLLNVLIPLIRPIVPIEIKSSTPKEEEHLISCMGTVGEKEAKSRLIEHNLRLVKCIDTFDQTNRAD